MEVQVEAGIGRLTSGVSNIPGGRGDHQTSIHPIMVYLQELQLGMSQTWFRE